jgi:outer membrane protein assembly factor BamB
VQYVIALDKRTGETVWKTDRTVDLSRVHYMTRKCYGTPTVYRAGDRLEMITPASRAVFAYDPQNGKELWKLRTRGWSVSPRPIYHEGLVYLVMDYDRPELWTVRPAGDGEQGEDAIVWNLRKGAPSTPSFLVLDGMVFLVSDLGIAMCLDAQSGEVIWRERLDGNYSASPLFAEGRVYFFNHDATATVIEAGRQYKQLAVNGLDGEMRASPAVCGTSLFLRTRTHLYRIDAGRSAD